MVYSIYAQGDISQFHPGNFLDFNSTNYVFKDNDVDFYIESDLAEGHEQDINHKVKFNLTIKIHEDQVLDCINNLKYKSSKNTYYIFNQWSLDQENSHVISYDYFFNRTKAYYSKFEFKNETIKWLYHKNSYKIIDDYDANKKDKIFISPSYVIRNTVVYRPQLAEFLKQYTPKLGYLSYYDIQYFNVLMPEFLAPSCKNISELENKIFNKNTRFGYSPPHSLYYKNTFLSIYTETVEYGSSFTITEKTYDPLIKGHFILPFSNYNFIKFMKKNEWKFPDFIDYSYDEIKDDNKRFEAYKKEVDRLLQIPIDDWRQLWQDNLDIIWHNQNLFYWRPYETIDLDKFLKNA